MTEPPMSGMDPRLGEEDMWNTLQNGPRGWQARAGGDAASVPDASNDDVAKALQSGPQGEAVESAPWYLHYPAMGLQTVTNALSSVPNLAIGGFNQLNQGGGLGTYRVGGGKAHPIQIPEIPQMDLGDVAKPQGWQEEVGTAALGGATVALEGGGVSRASALLGASGKELLREVPALLREVGVLGAAPAAATEGADQLGLKNAPEGFRQGLEIATGMVAAIAAHRFAGGNPFESVPAKLGTSETAEHAGNAAQKATQEWRAALPEKVEALKGITPGPITPEGDVIGDKLFGKIPLDTATADMSETMKIARSLNSKLGIFGGAGGFPEIFGDTMPPRVKSLLDRLAAANNPITEFPPKVEKVPSGPLRPDTSPIVEGSRSDLVTPPVPKLSDQRPAGLLGAPTEAPIASTPITAPQTNPLQSRMTSPEVAGIPPGVEPSPVQLPSTVLQSSAPTETVDPGMFGAKQVGESKGAGYTPPPPQRGMSVVPGEPPRIPEYETPPGTVMGFQAPIKDVMALRSYIGEMTTRGVFKGNDAAQVDALYKGLSADLGNTAKHYDALPEFNDYNIKTTQLYADGAKLSKFSNDDNPGKDTAKPGKEVSNMWGAMGKDSGDIATVRKHIPGAADEIAAAYLRQNPAGFIKLLKTNPDAAKALVPNPFDRLALSTATPEAASPLLEAQKTRETVQSPAMGFGLLNLMEAYNASHPGSPLMSPFTAAAIGTALPPVGRLIANVSKNPRVLKIPASGAAAVSPLLRQSDTTE